VPAVCTNRHEAAAAEMKWWPVPDGNTSATAFILSVRPYAAHSHGSASANLLNARKIVQFGSRRFASPRLGQLLLSNKSSHIATRSSDQRQMRSRDGRSRAANVDCWAQSSEEVASCCTTVRLMKAKSKYVPQAEHKMSSRVLVCTKPSIGNQYHALFCCDRGHRCSTGFVGHCCRCPTGKPRC
jgi:hypothetical protein